MPKLSHADVDYGPGNPRGDHCAICAHYLPDQRACEIVAPPIEPMGWCIKFEEQPDADDAA